MNNTFLSLGIMFLLILSGLLIGNFFDIRPEYYMPFLLWGLALCIFNMILKKNRTNIYMEEANI
jgi:hypothetical protein